MRNAGERLTCIGRLLAVSAIFALAYPALWRRPYSGQSVADGLTAAGLVLLAVGLFRLTGSLGIFDSTRYGWKKLVEIIRTRDYTHSRSELPSLAEYKRTHPYQRPYIPFLAAAVLDLTAAAAIL